MSKLLHIHKGKRINRHGRWQTLEKVSYIFDCPYCEYVMVYLSEENAVTGRNMHLLTAHPDEYAETIDKEVTYKTEKEFDKLVDKVHKFNR